MCLTVAPKIHYILNVKSRRNSAVAYHVIHDHMGSINNPKTVNPFNATIARSANPPILRPPQAHSDGRK